MSENQTNIQYRSICADRRAWASLTLASVVSWFDWFAQMITCSTLDTVPAGHCSSQLSNQVV